MNRLRISFRVAAVLHSFAEGIREIPSAFFLVANHTFELPVDTVTPDAFQHMLVD
jgi:hypothetical protein